MTSNKAAIWFLHFSMIILVVLISITEGPVIAYVCGWGCISTSHCILQSEALPGDCLAYTTPLYGSKVSCEANAPSDCGY